MRWIIRGLAALVILIGVLFAVGFVLPRDVAVTRSTVIDAPADAVWPHVNSLQAMGAWSPWLSRDPDMKVSFEGTEATVGSKMSWSSDVPEVGAGSQEITEIVEAEKIATALDFGDMGTAQAEIVLASEGDGTRVDWNFQTDMGGNPIGRWMGLMMDTWVGGDYETGLGNLKTLVEGG